MNKYQLALQVLQYIVENNIKFTVSINNRMFCTSDDNLANSKCILEYFGYNSPSKEMFPEYFRIRRYNNIYTSDKAVGESVGTLSIAAYKEKDLPLTIGDDFIMMAGLELLCYSNILHT